MLLMLLLPWQAVADSGIRFDIPRQRADGALTGFAQQAGMAVLFPYDTVSRVMTNPLTGVYGISEGLHILLDGTGLSAVVGPGDQITVRRVDGRGGDIRMRQHRGLIASLLALLTAGGFSNHANAQEVAAAAAAGTADNASPALSEVTVTGSRIQRPGMTSPAPITSLGGDELREMAPTTLIEAVSQLPQFMGNSSPQNTGVSWTGAAGASILNLRGVGANRTLVLLDGRRVVPSTRTGTIDISLFPESLVKRVDVATGGASAAYGSDAVSGVVNFMLDTQFTGVKANLQGGISDYGDDENTKASLAVGRNIGERGHVIVSVDYFKEEPIKTTASRDWFHGWGLVPNPDRNALPHYFTAPNVRSTQFTDGGLITSGPLKGTQFLPGGATAPFALGALSGSTTQSGGDGVDLSDIAYMIPGLRRGSAFTHGTFDLNDHSQVFGQLLYGTTVAYYNSPPAGAQYGRWPARIYSDNAYLPASISSRMAPGSSFTLGRSGDLDYGTGKGIQQRTDMVSATTGIKGDFGDGWQYNAYYQYGHTRSDITMFNAIRLDHIYQAIDAVVDPSSGNIVCRSSLMYPGNGCVPINLFGVGSPSQAATDYVQAPRVDQTQIVQQHVVDGTIQGEPFSTWAGKVSIATGASFRREWFHQTITPQSLQAIDMPEVGDPIGYRGLPSAYYGVDNIYERGPSQAPSGGYHVWEVFGETIVPLASELRFAKSLNLNAAFRWANYQGSGGIPAWKIGLDWQALDDVRFRGTSSRDVRAGTLSERFDTTRGPGTVTDPFLNTNDPQVFSQIAGGNPNVKPEKADTLTFGVVYQPSWLPGSGLSVDAYDITIKDAIGQLKVQDIVDQCYQGVQSLCDLITRDSSGAITTIRNVFINIAQAKTRGIDFETYYLHPVHLLGGAESLRVRGLATYVAEDSTIAQAGAAKINRVGQTGVRGGTPRWQGNMSVGYTNGSWDAFVEERFIGSGIYDATYVQGIDINKNTVSPAFYTNLRLAFDRKGTSLDYEIYATVSNLFDRAPPLAPSFGFIGTSDTNSTWFDTIGRRYNLGVNVKF